MKKSGMGKGLLALLAISAAWPVSAESVTLDLNGYYRLRGKYFHNLDLKDKETIEVDDEETTIGGVENTAFTVQRLRLEPALRVNENLGIFLSMDILDNVMGGNQSQSPPLFAGDGDNSTYYGPNSGDNLSANDSIQVKRAWVETKTSVGAIRFGRMPSHFGIGLFANDGGNGVGLTEKTLEEKWASYFDEDFGDNDTGSTYDRLIFITKPAGKDSDLILGLFWDHLAEGLDQDLSGALSSGRDDVDEYGAVLYYLGQPNKDTGNLTRGGVYSIWRTMPSTQSDIYVVDGHFLVKRKPIYAEGELTLLFGQSKAGGIPFHSNLEAGFGDVYVSVIRFGYDNDTLRAGLEAGISAGDDQLRPSASGFVDDGEPPYYPECSGTDEKCSIKTFNMHRNHKVGLLLWDQVIAQQLGAFTTTAAGAVINAFYLYPQFKYRLGGKKIEGTHLLGALLWAKSMEAAQFRGTMDDETDLGLEIDLGVQHYLSQNLRIEGQAAYLIPGKGIPIASPEEDPDHTWGLISKFTVVF